MLEWMPELNAGSARLSVLLCGHYDLGKPRVRLMREALRSDSRLSVAERHRPHWERTRDKSRLSAAGWLRHALRWLGGLPGLWRSYLSAPAHHVLIVGYPGAPDVLLLWPLARLRGARIVWDMFTSAYDTTVRDRRLLPRYHPLAAALYALEWLACRAADTVVLDTQTHAQAIARLFRCDAARFAVVPVGCEETVFTPLPARAPDGLFRVLFYGQLIPLHGLDVILEAARRCEDAATGWQIIGSGQEEARLRDPLPPCVDWLPWVAYEELPYHIARADVCLGIFGDSEKAACVIPNKLYQALACGRPVITRDSPALRELPSEAREAVTRVPPGDAAALLEAVCRLKHHPPGARTPYRPAKTIARQWADLVINTTAGRHRSG